MIRNVKEAQFKDSDVISASEIGQYLYCPMAWYLQKCGYKPESSLLERGERKHSKLGVIVDRTRINIIKSRILTIAGYLLMLVAILVITFEVILYIFH